MSEVHQYRLYASRNLTPPNGVEYSLIPSCSNGRYILLYTDKMLENGYKQLDESVNLEHEERAWLTSVKIAVNNRYLQEHEQEYTELFNGFCDSLEKELAEEKKRLADSAADNVRKPKYKVGETVYFVHIKGYGKTIDECRVPTVFEFTIRRVYCGKTKITYYVKEVKMGIDEALLYGTKAEAERRREELREKLGDDKK